MKIATLDPGLENFAYCVAEIEPLARHSPPAVIETGKFRTTLRDYDDATIDVMSSMVEDFFNKFELGSGDVFFAERYTTRGGFGGQSQNRLVEPIGLMLGCFIHEAKQRDVEVILVTASTWKSFLIKRKVDWQLIIERRHRAGAFGRNVHERDCMGMLQYYWRRQLLEVARASAHVKRLNARARGRTRA